MRPPCDLSSGHRPLTQILAAKKPIARQSSLLLLGMFLTLPLFANTVTVTTTNDSAAGSLRDAIAIAAPGDTISFSVTGTITLASPITISTSLTINGPGAANLAISGDGAVQIFVISPGSTVAISGVTIEKGVSSGAGGGIFNSGTLTLSGVTVFDNSAFVGAGIFNQGSLSIENSIITGNVADNGGGGIYNDWHTPSILIVTNSTLSGNSANGAGGGGIYNGSSLTVKNTTFSTNSAYYGGGISNQCGLRTTVTNSTFFQNHSGLGGGGISNFGYGGVLTVTNATFWGNSGNEGGAIQSSSGTAAIKNTLLSQSYQAQGFPAASCYGTISSQGYNLSDDSSCQLSATGDLSSTPAGIDPNGLQNNGGPTQTVALLSTSAAVDAIPLSYCTDTNGNPIATDQRGITRPQGSACDMGAFELMPSALYGVCLLYDPTKAVHSAASIPVKLQLCDGSGNDLSSTGITVHAVSVTLTSFSISGAVEDSGSANPDSDFRFDSTLGITGGYIFNLKTTGLSTGTYSLNFTVTGDSFVYSAPFQVK